jgi:hypothetical protein
LSSFSVPWIASRHRSRDEDAAIRCLLQEQGISGQIFARREFDSLLGETAAGGEMTCSQKHTFSKHWIITRTLKLLDALLNKLQAHEDPISETITIEQVNEGCFGSCRWGGWRLQEPVQKQPNRVRSCDLLIGREKGDLSKLRLVA